MRKAIIISVVIVFVGFMATCIYFAGGVSATIPPIEKYEYHGNIRQFGDLLEAFSKVHPQTKFKVSARDSANLHVNFRDIDIEAKQGTDSLSFGLACEENVNNNVWETELDLVQAWNKTRLTGGYGAKAVGMKPLLDYFEKNLLFEIKKEYHTDINVKKEGFFERIHIY